MKKTIIILLLAFAVAVGIQDFLNSRKKHIVSAPRNYTVVLSLDGFRWDYDTKASTPSLDFISQHGVKAEGLQPVFPAKTFPNHYTIATGLYPEHHGIVSNHFFAPDAKGYYSIGDRSAIENSRFYLGEPIWVTAEAQQVKTGTYFWVGSEASIKGYRPTYWKKYDQKLPDIQRVDSVIAWLNKPYQERPHLVMWYLEKADKVGHNFGPDSPQIMATITRLDSVIGLFMQKARELDIKDSINFIIVSDHGMGAMDSAHTIYLDEFIKRQWVDTALFENPIVQIQTQKGCTDSILSAVSKVTGIKAWAKNKIPERFHLKHSIRIPEIIMLADSGWSVMPSKKHKSDIKGTHGYDNLNRDMYGVFYGMGPDFKRNYNAGILYNIDIYNLMARLLEIKPAPNDGQPERIMNILKEKGEK